jgi:hypothetical protein
MRDLEIVQFGETIKGTKVYYVKCGCKTFVFTEVQQLISFIVDYINDPAGFEKKWYEDNEKIGGADGTSMPRAEIGRDEMENRPVAPSGIGSLGST